MPKQIPTPSHPPPDTWTILKLVQWTTAYFESRGIDSPRSTAEILLAHILDITRIDLYLRYDQPMAASELARYREAIRRRARREPVAYITGQREFWSMPLDVNQQVLIPRPETECLVELALDEIPEAGDGQPCRILDLGTGSGAIILALAKERADHWYVALDRQPAAVRLAKKNAVRQGLATGVRFICGDWFACLNATGSRFDLIVSNPPYVRAGEIDGLQPEVARYEPRTALDGGPDGLACLRHIITAAPGFLKPGGTLILEIGYDQAEAVLAMARHRKVYGALAVENDFSGLPRVARMKLKN